MMQIEVNNNDGKVPRLIKGVKKGASEYESDM